MCTISGTVSAPWNLANISEPPGIQFPSLLWKHKATWFLPVWTQVVQFSSKHTIIERRMDTSVCWNACSPIKFAVDSSTPNDEAYDELSFWPPWALSEYEIGIMVAVMGFWIWKYSYLEMVVAMWCTIVLLSSLDLTENPRAQQGSFLVFPVCLIQRQKKSPLGLLGLCTKPTLMNKWLFGFMRPMCCGFP